MRRAESFTVKWEELPVEVIGWAGECKNWMHKLQDGPEIAWEEAAWTSSIAITQRDPKAAWEPKRVWEEDAPGQRDYRRCHWGTQTYKVWEQWTEIKDERMENIQWNRQPIERCDTQIAACSKESTILRCGGKIKSGKWAWCLPKIDIAYQQ